MSSGDRYYPTRAQVDQKMKEYYRPGLYVDREDVRNEVWAHNAKYGIVTDATPPRRPQATDLPWYMQYVLVFQICASAYPVRFFDTVEKSFTSLGFRYTEIRTEFSTQSKNLSLGLET
jgi:hypothetical protein